MQWSGENVLIYVRYNVHRIVSLFINVNIYFTQRGSQSVDMMKLIFDLLETAERCLNTLTLILEFCYRWNAV